MKPVFGLSSAMALLLTAPAVWAHPGHMHGLGPVHGFSWTDLAGFLLASIVLPAAATLVVHWRNRRRH